MVFLTRLIRASKSVGAGIQKNVYVIGLGMTKFEKPGARLNFDYPDMAKEAGTRALEDARVKYSDVQQAVCGYVYGESTCGQRAVYGLGMTGIPVYNVNNNCSTGSTALMLAKQMVEGGQSDCVLALGFEKMERGSLGMKYTDRCIPLDKHVLAISDIESEEAKTGVPFAPLIFGAAAKEYMDKYGVKASQMAQIAEKNHAHSGANPYSQFQQRYSLEQILGSPKVALNLTKLQCCPTSDGAAAAVIASEEFVRTHKLEDRAVRILGMHMVTDMGNSFEPRSAMGVAGYHMSKTAANKLYKQTGLTPKDFQVVELHDCFSANELITYDALGLCAPGKAGSVVESSWRGAGGPHVVNTSGGLISKGHPLGATGLAQCAELCWQLRGEAGERQVKGVKNALQHNIGLGGAAVVTGYTLGWPDRLPRDSATGRALSLKPGQKPEHERKLFETLAKAKYVKKEAKA